MREWYQEDSFWEDMYNFMFPDSRFKNAEEEVKNIIELVDYKGEKVLDLCCGPGRHTYEFAKLNNKVTAVDRTKFLLDKAKSYCSSEKSKIEFVKKDMRDFVRKESFDLVINLFTSFGYFKNEDENIKVLQNIYDNLKKGGKLVLDMMGKEILAQKYKESSVHEYEDITLIEKRKIVNNWRRIQNEWILLKEGDYKTYSFSHTLYSGQELNYLLKDIGFKNINLYGSFEGEKYGLDAKRLVVTAEK